MLETLHINLLFLPFLSLSLYKLFRCVLCRGKVRLNSFGSYCNKKAAGKFDRDGCLSVEKEEGAQEKEDLLVGCENGFAAGHPVP